MFTPIMFSKKMLTLPPELDETHSKQASLQSSPGAFPLLGENSIESPMSKQT